LPLQIGTSGPLIPVNVDPYTSFAEMYDKLVKKIQIYEPHNYFLFFRLREKEICITNSKQKVLDLVGRAERTPKDTVYTRYTPFGELPEYNFRIVRKHFPHPLQATNIVELDIMFYTIVDTILFGNYSCTFEDAMLLGGLIAQAAHGDYKPANPVIRAYAFHFHFPTNQTNATLINRNTVQQFLRAEHDLPTARENLAEELSAQHASHLGMPATEAKAQVLRIFSKWKWAECIIFPVEQPKKTPSQFLLAIAPTCMMLLNESDMVSGVLLLWIPNLIFCCRSHLIVNHSK
jgi:hypothetical protein